MSMMVSLSGVLIRAAKTCERNGAQHLDWPLRELLRHLDEMYQRRAEPGILDEFFAIYVAPSKDLAREELKRELAKTNDHEKAIELMRRITTP